MSAGEEDDSDLFRQAMAKDGVRKVKLGSDKVPHSNSAPKPRTKIGPTTSKRHARQEEISQEESLKTAAIDQTLTTGPVLFVRRGISKNRVRELRRDQLPIEESIDLHGMREREASRALEQFLGEARHFQWQCVRIIHGKGRNSEEVGGVLRPMTLHWLKKQPDVLAFCSASARDGGTGATNVLLNLR